VTESDEISRGDSGAPPIGPVEADPEALWHRFHRRLVIVGMRRLGSRADAEDAAQETLQRVTQALKEKRLREVEALPGFVLQTAVHVCQQWLRKRGREHRALDGYAQEPDTTEDISHPLTGLIDDERRTVVRSALKSLPAEERHLLEQIYVQDTDPLHLAERLGITPGALRVRKHRILKRLSELLHDTVMD
jgi:RNA polymerase sigma-70 factor (ECF subfamily)